MFKNVHTWSNFFRLLHISKYLFISFFSIMFDVSKCRSFLCLNSDLEDTSLHFTLIFFFQKETSKSREFEVTYQKKFCFFYFVLYHGFVSILLAAASLHSLYSWAIDLGHFDNFDISIFVWYELSWVVLRDGIGANSKHCTIG